MTAPGPVPAPPDGGARRHPLRWTGLSARRASSLCGGGVFLLLCLATLGAAWLLRQRALGDWRGDMASLSLVLAENVSQTMASTYLLLDRLHHLGQASQDQLGRSYVLRHILGRHQRQAG